MREAALERRVCRDARARGWLAFKWRSPNQRGVPDRIFFRRGEIVFVEFKAPGRKPTRLQAHVHRALRQEGVNVRVIDNLDAAAALLP